MARLYVLISLGVNSAVLMLTNIVCTLSVICLVTTLQRNPGFLPICRFSCEGSPSQRYIPAEPKLRGKHWREPRESPKRHTFLLGVRKRERVSNCSGRRMCRQAMGHMVERGVRSICLFLIQNQLRDDADGHVKSGRVEFARSPGGIGSAVDN